MGPNASGVATAMDQERLTDDEKVSPEIEKIFSQTKFDKNKMFKF